MLAPRTGFALGPEPTAWGLLRNLFEYGPFQAQFNIVDTGACGLVAVIPAKAGIHFPAILLRSQERA